MSAIIESGTLDPATPTVFRTHTLLLRDFRLTLLALCLLVPLILWVSWLGETFPILLLMICVVIFGLPALALVAAISLLWSHPVVRLVRRMAIQGLILGVLLVPVTLLGAMVKDLSVLETRRRGDRIVVILEEYRKARGQLPLKLADLEGPDRLPRPTVRSEFSYFVDPHRNEFELGFSVGDSLALSMWVKQRGSGWIRD